MGFITWSADPVLVSFAGLQIHWYGAIFATAILSGFHIVKWVYQREGLAVESLDSLFIYSIVGIIVGARLGHCFFYDPAYYLSNPLKIIAVWEGGLASHGGGLGFIVGAYLYNRKHKLGILWLLDRLTLPAALFGFFVRIGNFVNSEILGTPTDFPLAIVFTRIDNLARHPVQLYESFSYFCIFVLLFSIYKFTKIRERSGTMFGLFLCLVFSARFLLEFVKEKQASYAADSLVSTGQLLSIPFLLIGIILIVMCSFRKNTEG